MKNILTFIILTLGIHFSFAQENKKVVPINDLRKWGVLSVCEMPTNDRKDGDVAVDKILIVTNWKYKKDTIEGYEVHFYKMYENKIKDYTMGYYHEESFDKALYHWENDTIVSVTLVNTFTNKKKNM